MLSYVPAMNRIVTLLSSMHSDSKINVQSRRKKPEIIHFYNDTKGEGGVDTTISGYWPTSELNAGY